nr:EamA family transporter [Bacillus ectoiniformans]
MSYLSVILGAACWGVIGVFVNYLYKWSFTPWQVVGIRVFVSALILFSFLLIFRPQLLKVRLRDIPYFIGTGIISIAFFNYCFFSVIEQANLSLAVVLLYTGPVFVTLISRVVFKEALTIKKWAALAIMVVGCAFTVGLLPSAETAITLLTVLTGLASGFFYSLYTIFSKFIGHRYHSLTITAYSMLLGTLFVLPTSALWEKADLFIKPQVIINAAGLALISTIFAYLLYTAGLKGMESSKAAMLATIEPVVGIAIGVLFFRDVLTAWQGLGIVLLFSSILLTIQRQPSNSFIQTKSPRSLN